jgi:hypothetical protein
MTGSASGGCSENVKPEVWRRAPPGIGFTAGPGRILHICPGEDGRALVHYHFSERQRWLGLIPHDAAVVRTKHAVESSQLAEVVRHFFDDDHEWLVGSGLPSGVAAPTDVCNRPRPVR